MAGRKQEGRRRKPAAARLCGCGLAVEAEEREHLVRACAFFRAGRFRAVEAHRVRAGDLEAAAADIGAVLDRRKRPPSAARLRRRQPGKAGSE